MGAIKRKQNDGRFTPFLYRNIHVYGADGTAARESPY